MTDIQIQCFLTTAETKSIIKAAEILFRSPQAVSKHLANMEKELNCTLFSKNSKGSILSEIGEKYYHFYKEQHRDYKHMMHTITHMYEAMRFHFRVGISTWIDPFGRINDAFLKYAEANPSTDIDWMQLQNNALLEAIDNKKLDVAIVCDSQISIHPEYNTMRIASEDLRIFSAKELQAKNNGDYIFYDAPYGNWSPQQWEVISKRLSDRHIEMLRHETYHMPNLESSIINVENHCGITVCDANFGKLSSEDPAFSNTPINLDSYLSCIWLKTNEHPMISEFSDFLKNHFCNL